MTDAPDPQLTVGDSVSLPATEVLSGRGFITGKSGSGKSNTASVIAEELLAETLPLLIIDTDGEYYGLKEAYEVLHLGATEDCDACVGPDHGDAIARLALDERVPIVLDVSGFLDGDAATELVAETVRSLFARERDARQPFLLIVEEIHEYLPEGRGYGPAGEALVTVAKRGRKRGLGLLGISQRPAAVAKAFITQCDWLCWHRLTWDNDTRVVGRVLGDAAAAAVQDLDDGEALLSTDWNGRRRRVQFRRKHTYDAGTTPGLDDVDRPAFEPVGALTEQLAPDVPDDAATAATTDADANAAGVGTADEHESAALPPQAPATVEQLRERLAEREARIAALERRLDDTDAADPGADRASCRASPTAATVWEAGQLSAHLFVTAGRALARVVDRTGHGLRRVFGAPGETSSRSDRSRSGAGTGDETGRVAGGRERPD